MLEKILPFLIAAGIGLAIGIERERRYANTKKAMGVRTFILLSLLGALAAFVQDAYIAMVLTGLAAALIVAAYIQSTTLLDTKDVELGLTTEFAAGVTFAIGYLTRTEPFLCAVLGLLTLIVLLSRERLHEFTLKQIRSEEIQAAVVLFVLALGVLPLLPTEPIDSLGIIDLRRFVTVLLLIGSVQFASYLATRIFGASIGFPLAGFVSGLVSSTAVFLQMPQRVKENPEIARAAAAASLLAAVSTFIFLIVVVGAISAPLALQIAPPLILSMVVGALFAVYLARSEGRSGAFPEPKNPLSLLGSIKLAALLSGFMIGVGLLEHFVGDRGTEIASFIVGLGELHGISIASATLFANEKISMQAAEANILLAGIGSLTSKVIITLVLRRSTYTPWLLGVVLFMIVGFLAAWFLPMPW